MDTIQLAVDVREAMGKKARFLRRDGLTPANIYGRNLDSVALQLPSADLIQALSQGGQNAVLDVKVKGEKTARTAVIRNIQRNPVTDVVIHVDFLQVDVTRAITSDVPLVFVGESPLPKTQTVISQILASIQVSGLPMQIPNSIEVDVSVLEEIDQSIFVRDLNLPDDIEVLTDGDQMIVRATPGRVAEVLPGEEEEDAEVGDSHRGRPRIRRILTPCPCPPVNLRLLLCNSEAPRGIWDLPRFVSPLYVAPHPPFLAPIDTLCPLCYYFLRTPVPNRGAHESFVKKT